VLLSSSFFLFPHKRFGEAGYHLKIALPAAGEDIVVPGAGDQDQFFAVGPEFCRRVSDSVGGMSSSC